ncbi:hypothetical protein [Nocardia arizonensis]|uniref:hypothetical protein n=1 Tax=Nocardia arizonensis TaxID=1141647 RepID=UPI000B175185|nr:hypothetical protein [Nocardia arizonensis]
MMESGGGSPPGNGAPENSTRILAAVAAVAALIAVVVAVGSVLRTDDQADGAPASTVPAAPVSARTTTVPGRPTAIPRPTPVPAFSAPNTSPLPTRPAHRVGEDCMTDGVTGRWDVVTGTGWVCVPVVPSAAPSTVPTQAGP